MGLINETDILNGEDKITIEAIVNAMRLSAEEVHINVKATEDILKGQPVRYIGYNLGLDEIEIALGDNLLGKTIGLAGEDIANGGSGFIVQDGSIINFDTSAYAEGTALYVNGTGTLTATEPTVGLRQPVAFVLKSNANTGALMVNVSYPKQDADDVRYDATNSVKDILDLKVALTYLNDTWGGSSNITTLGTITSGVWTGTAISFANIQDIATATFVGRNTAGSGVAEELNIATVKTMLDIDSTFTSDEKIKLGYISVTQNVDLDLIETRVNQLDASVVLKGEWDASGGSFPISTKSGESWIISVGGTVDGVEFVANDRIVALVDGASTTVYATNWLKLDYTDAVLSVGGYTGAVTLTQLGLNLVENTALSTWVGTASITTLGTITSGEWTATSIADGYISSASTWNAKVDYTLGSNIDVNDKVIGSSSNGNIAITPDGTGKTDITNLVAEIPLNTQTGTTYTAVLLDSEKMITLDNASAITMTIPANASVAYPVGTKLNFMQLGAGQATIAITTDTLNKDSALTAKLNGQYAVATAVKVTSISWVLFGNLELA